jgi:large subunit ribosomal protein L10
MRRDQKVEIVEQIAAQITEAEAIYAADYRGLSVTQAAALRASLRDADATLRVVKNTLTLRAAEKAGAEQVKELIEGPTAFAFVQGDPAAAAKALDTFARQEQVLALRGGLLDGELLSADAVRELARLPGRDQLNAQLAGVVAAPLTGLVRGLGALVSGLAVALGQVREQKEAEAPQEAETEPTAEAEEAEAPAPQEPQTEPTAEAEEAEASESTPEGEDTAATAEPGADEGQGETAEGTRAQAAEEAQGDATEDQAEASEKEAE